jgi:hypothetical protein
LREDAGAALNFEVAALDGAADIRRAEEGAGVAE